MPAAESATAAVRPAIDWITLLVAIGCYLAFGLVTYFHAALPWWLLLPLGAYIVCLQGGLQHEAVHGYPFRARWLNTALVFPSLWLWLPYTHYRDSHSRHHRDPRLTCPIDDPESNYIKPDVLAKMGAFHRLVRAAMTTLAGRLAIGPAFYAWQVWTEALNQLAAGDWQALKPWAIHIPGAAVTLWWAIGVCDMPLWAYILFFAYPGTSLTVMRSYCEHRAREKVGERSAIVESGPILSFVYLNNNLHAVHHRDPSAVWHRRPALYRQIKDEILAENGGYVFKGYREIIGRYLFKAKEPLEHPYPTM